VGDRGRRRRNWSERRRMLSSRILKGGGEGGWEGVRDREKEKRKRSWRMRNTLLRNR
jgi:hypothetical protein